MTDKFRVWLREEKRMWLPQSEPVLNPIVLSQEGDLLELVDEDLENDTARTAVIYLPGTYDILWFIGVIDKEGTEVYEGDILQATKNKKCLVKIEWDENQLRYVGINQAGDNNTSLTLNSWKVIGNIYENPDLLTKV